MEGREGGEARKGWEGGGGKEGGMGEGGREGGEGGRIEGGRGVRRDKALSNGDLRGGEIEHDVQADEQPEESTVSGITPPSTTTPIFALGWQDRRGVKQ